MLNNILEWCITGGIRILIAIIILIVGWIITDKLVKVTRTRNMTIAIHKCGGNKIDYTELTGKGHLIWNYVYNQPSTFQWMFAQKKKK